MAGSEGRRAWFERAKAALRRRPDADPPSIENTREDERVGRERNDLIAEELWRRSDPRQRPDPFEEDSWGRV
jgi:hypothetical protein